MPDVNDIFMRKPWYYIGFTEKTVVAELMQMEQEELEAKNKEFFKEKVVNILSKESGKGEDWELIKQSEAANIEDILPDDRTEEQFMQDFMESFNHPIKTEKLTFKGELFKDDETTIKTMKNLTKLADNFL